MCFCGEKGWVMLVGTGGPNRKIPCPECGGTGKVRLPFRHPFRCGKCKGAGRVNAECSGGTSDATPGSHSEQIKNTNV